MTHLSKIQTPSQTWAKHHHACLAGRRRLGRLSLWEYFHSSRAVISDLIWAAKRLCPAGHQYADAYFRACNNAYYENSGRGGMKRVRGALFLAMRQYDVRWPVHLL